MDKPNTDKLCIFDLDKTLVNAYSIEILANWLLASDMFDPKWYKQLVLLHKKYNSPENVVIEPSEFDLRVNSLCSNNTRTNYKRNKTDLFFNFPIFFIK